MTAKTTRVAQELEAFLARDQLALRRKDGRDAHQVLRGDAASRRASSTRSTAPCVCRRAFGEEDFLRDHASFPNFDVPSVGMKIEEVFLKTFPHESIASGRARTGFRINLSGVHGRRPEPVDPQELQRRGKIGGLAHRRDSKSSGAFFAPKLVFLRPKSPRHCHCPKLRG